MKSRKEDRSVPVPAAPGTAMCTLSGETRVGVPPRCIERWQLTKYVPTPPFASCGLQHPSPGSEADLSPLPSGVRLAANPGVRAEPKPVPRGGAQPAQQQGQGLFRDALHRVPRCRVFPPCNPDEEHRAASQLSPRPQTEHSEERTSCLGEDQVPPWLLPPTRWAVNGRDG